MTKKHFEAIARILNSQIKSIPTDAAMGFDEGYVTGRADALDNVISDLADYFATVNPNFDKARFMTAATTN